MSDNNGDSVTRLDLYRSLGSIEGKLDGLSNTFVGHIKDDKENFILIGQRLSEISKRLYTTAGYVTAAAAGATMLVNFLVTHVK